MTGEIISDGGPQPAFRPRVAIGIPTFRRPEKLARLLTSLEPSLRSVPAIVIVADNACLDDTRAQVEAFGASWPGTRYLAVPTRGISANRNALIDAFLAHEPALAWLAMLDDDLVAQPDWLEQMIEVADRVGADAVGAPYAMAKPTGNFVIDNSTFVKADQRPSGTSGVFFAAGNILLSHGLLSSPTRPKFDHAFGLSGGEDYDFFSRIAIGGARFGWCAQAFCVEDVDVDRLTTRAVFYRYYSSGNYMAAADRKNHGSGYALRHNVKGFAKSIYIVLHGSAKLDRTRALRGLLFVALYTGGLAGMLGRQQYRYR